MSHIERATAILEFLQGKRAPDGLIPAISSLDLMQAMGAQASHGVAFAQANSLLDIASLDTGLPLIGYLVNFDRGDQCQGAWANWELVMPFIALAPRFKAWSDEDFRQLQEALSNRPGNPAALWEAMGEKSDELLRKSVNVAREVLMDYADRALPRSGPAAVDTP